MKSKQKICFFCLVAIVGGLAALYFHIRSRMQHGLGKSMAMFLTSTLAVPLGDAQSSLAKVNVVARYEPAIRRFIIREKSGGASEQVRESELRQGIAKLRLNGPSVCIWFSRDTLPSPYTPKTFQDKFRSAAISGGAASVIFVESWPDRISRKDLPNHAPRHNRSAAPVVAPGS